jgi:phosphoenolpyruvate-protein phosphotransferase (PTS system enzyme I)
MTKAKTEVILNGIPASPGEAFGEARVIYSWERTIEDREISADDVEKEIVLLDKAVEESLTEILKLKGAARRKIGAAVSGIFESQLMIISDREFLNQVKDQIRGNHKSAEYTYSMEVEKTIEPLLRSKDPYMKQMAIDIEAVSNRIVRRLTGKSIRHLGQALQDCIFVGKTFTPAEVISLSERRVRGIITAEGSPNSHMTLIARSLLIPTLVGVPQAHLTIKSGDRIIMDGDRGTVKIHPTHDEWNLLRKKKAHLTARHFLKLDKIEAFPPTTLDNVKVNLAANVELTGPVDRVLAEANIGVGLYRTEFTYLRNGRFPDEEEQFKIYDSVAKCFYPRSVVIRTYDLGSDKYYDTDKLGRESNPALGIRGIRAAFNMPKIFRTQIKSVLRASTRHNIKLLLPMISDIAELNRARGVIRRTMLELRKAGEKYDENIPVGIMIEVPSAALAADILAEKASFFSIGSNDLTQYTLAADRDNQKLAQIFNPLHPSVLRLIRMTIEAASKRNIPVNVCGEMAGDILTIPLLLGMGIEQLSMNPSRLYAACKLISRIKLSDTKIMAEKVARLKSTKEVENLLHSF